MNSPASPVLNSTTYQLKEKVAQLQEAILHKHPTMKLLLREIHSTLTQYPEQVTLLSEEDISQIVQGLSQQTGTELATATLKSASASKKIKALGAAAF